MVLTLEDIGKVFKLKPKRYFWCIDIQESILNGTDVYIEIEDNFPKIDEVIESFKQLTENIIMIGLENISFNKERNTLNINV